MVQRIRRELGPVLLAVELVTQAVKREGLDLRAMWVFFLKSMVSRGNIPRRKTYWIGTMKLLLENLPASLQDQRATLARCLEAMNEVIPFQAVYLFGSHARGQARADSDVDLCIVAEGAERQLKTAQAFGAALQAVWPRPSFTLIPITPQRLQEKKAIGDFFFRTVLQEGVLLAA